MNMSLRYPNITGRTEREQMAQVNSYLRQMVDQLNFALQGQGGTGQAGADGKDGKNGADGKNGVDGKTPQRGVDYWTPLDVQEIVNQAVAGVLKEKATLLEATYPVGAVYVSTVSTNPETLFGFGTWTQIKDTFLLAAGDTYSAGSTGGEATHTLTVDEMPSHTHTPVIASSAGVAQQFKLNNGWHGNTKYPAFDISGNQSSHAVYLSTEGNSKPHNNMPPYYTVYVWRRTA